MLWAILNIIYYYIIPINDSIIFVGKIGITAGIGTITMEGTGISIVKGFGKF